jgi:hypothetical protein
MSICGIQSSVTNPYQPAVNSVQQQVQQLAQDLQSGNLSAAQSDFATLQQAFSQSTATPGTASNGTSAATTNAFEQAFQQVGSDLKAGNVAAAQKDFNTVQHDLHRWHDPLRDGFNPQGSGGWNAAPDGKTSPIQDVNGVGQGVASSNLTGAQQAYTSLQQELQQFALGSGAVSAESLVSLDV